MTENVQNRKKPKISNGYKDISVELIDYNMNIAEHAWNCYRMTWNDLQNIEYNPQNPDVRECIKNIILMRALPMPREQAIMTFRINNISRVCLAQITRQRKACFNVESQMPRPINHNVILPLNIAKSEFAERAKQLIKDSQALYNDLIKAGFPPQDTRYITMHGQTTSLVYVVDINTFVSSFGFRCENNLSDEINLVYRLCKKAILDKINEDYDNKKIDFWTYTFYNEIISKADCAGASKHVGQNYDKVFGNSFERYPSMNKEIEDITENCDYDYKKSAWYLELKRIAKLHPELLFDNEKEMIDSWKN